MKKIISMTVVLILGITFIVCKQKLNLAAAEHEPIDMPNIIYYIPKCDEELEYWLV